MFSLSSQSQHELLVIGIRHEKICSWWYTISTESTRSTKKVTVYHWQQTFPQEDAVVEAGIDKTLRFVASTKGFSMCFRTWTQNKAVSMVDMFFHRAKVFHQVAVFITETADNVCVVSVSLPVGFTAWRFSIAISSFCRLSEIHISISDIQSDSFQKLRACDRCRLTPVVWVPAGRHRSRFSNGCLRFPSPFLSLSSKYLCFLLLLGGILFQLLHLLTIRSAWGPYRVRKSW